MLEWKDMIDTYYKLGIYTEEQVKVFVPGFITQQECDEILKKA